VIRELILSGAYGPGYHVVIETLAKEFRVSRPPVRAAIRRLEAEGLLVWRANSEAQVTSPDPYRGSASVAEREALIELIASEAPFERIEQAARDRRLQGIANISGTQNTGLPSALHACPTTRQYFDARRGRDPGRPKRDLNKSNSTVRNRTGTILAIFVDRLRADSYARDLDYEARTAAPS
jgi:DNA-binding transcriptional regulator YhcF (GntR family)